MSDCREDGTAGHPDECCYVLTDNFPQVVDLLMRRIVTTQAGRPVRVTQARTYRYEKRIIVRISVLAETWNHPRIFQRHVEYPTAGPTRSDFARILSAEILAGVKEYVEHGRSEGLEELWGEPYEDDEMAENGSDFSAYCKFEPVDTGRRIVAALLNRSIDAEPPVGRITVESAEGFGQKWPLTIRATVAGAAWPHARTYETEFSPAETLGGESPDDNANALATEMLIAIVEYLHTGVGVVEIF